MEAYGKFFLPYWFALLSCCVVLIIDPQPICPGMASPRLGWILSIQLAAKKMPPYMVTGYSNRDNFLVEIPSFFCICVQ